MQPADHRAVADADDRALVAPASVDLTVNAADPHADAPAGALVLGDGADRVAVWRFPHDPALPGLAAACDEAAVANLLDETGLGGGPVRLRTRAYRPRRRAVIEAVGSRGRLFIKVVRPDQSCRCRLP